MMVYGTAANDKITAANTDDTLVGWTGDDTYVISNREPEHRRKSRRRDR